MQPPFASIMKLLLVLGFGVLFLTACVSPMESSHGFIPDETNPEEIMVGEDDRTTVAARLGSPTLEDSFEGETWYYITTKKEQLAYFKPKAVERKIVAISFDNSGNVANIFERDLSAAQTVAIVNRETPTRGKELTIMEQLLGNVGQLPGGIADEDGPGQ